jgi:hypothetical protein
MKTLIIEAVQDLTVGIRLCTDGTIYPGCASMEILILSAGRTLTIG